MPAHLALNFERGAELGRELRKETPMARELTVAEALALALPRLLEDKDALRAAWSGGEPFERTLVVETRSGDVEVSLRAPHGRAPAEHELPEDIFAELGELGEDGEAIEPEARAMLERELLRRFAASKELAAALSDPSKFGMAKTEERAQGRPQGT